MNNLIIQYILNKKTDRKYYINDGYINDIDNCFEIYIADIKNNIFDLYELSYCFETGFYIESIIQYDLNLDNLISVINNY